MSKNMSQQKDKKYRNSMPIDKDNLLTLNNEQKKGGNNFLKFATGLSGGLGHNYSAQSISQMSRNSKTSIRVLTDSDSESSDGEHNNYDNFQKDLVENQIEVNQSPRQQDLEQIPNPAPINNQFKKVSLDFEKIGQSNYD